jgi:hypothetical protein
MNEREEIRRELKDIAPFLFKYEVHESFEAPEGYFDGFPSRISERLRNNKQWWKINLETFSVPRLATAAGIATLILVALFIFRRPEDKPLMANNTHSTTVVTSEIESDIVATEVDEETVATLYLEKAANKELQNPEEKNAIENYLLENADEQLLKEEL